MKGKGAKKMKPGKGTKGMTGKQFTQIERGDMKGNKKAIKKAQKNLKNQVWYGRNY